MLFFEIVPIVALFDMEIPPAVVAELITTPAMVFPVTEKLFTHWRLIPRIPIFSVATVDPISLLLITQP